MFLCKCFIKEKKAKLYNNIYWLKPETSYLVKSWQGLPCNGTNSLPTSAGLNLSVKLLGKREE